MSANTKPVPFGEFMEQYPNGTKILVDELIPPDDPADVAEVFEMVMDFEEVGRTWKVRTETRTMLVGENAVVHVLLEGEGT
jgi:hypothetical protein